MSDKIAAPSVRITGVTTIAVPVKDPERALDFYVGTLGFEKRRDATFGPGQRWVEVAPPGAVTTIALAPPRDGVTTGGDTGIRLSSENPEADHEQLRTAGVDVDAEIMRLGGPVPPMFYIRDPDGNALVIVGNRAG
jgi:catechol 2,3-dioxygenase-like lactoylglutathione lyase family enzyme